MTEPSPPNAGPMKRWMIAVALTLLVCAAFAFRLWNIDFDYPDFYHADEHMKVDILTRLINFEQTDYMRHPGFTMNTMATWNWIARAAGGSMDELSIALRARMTVALFGALCMIPGYLLGATLFDRRTGIVAAILIGAAPLLVVHSRYHKEDLHLSFFVLLSAWALAVWMKREDRDKSMRWLALSAAAGGAAMGTKYIGASMVVIAATAGAIHNGGRPRWKAAASMVGVGLLAFLIVSPQAILWIDVAWRDLRYEYMSGVHGKHTPSLDFYQWPDLGTYFFYYAVGPGLTWPLALAALWAVILGLRGRRSNRALFWISIVAVVWYVMPEISPRKRATDTERYLAPCVALGAVMAAGLLMRMRPERLFQLRIPRAVWTPAAALFIAWAAIRSIWITEAAHPDTRLLAAEWLRDNAPFEQLRIAHQYRSERRSIDSMLSEAEFIEIDGMSLMDDEDEDDMEEVLENREAFSRANVLMLTEISTARHENFANRTRSRRNISEFNDARRRMPYMKRFEKHPFVSTGWHNPYVELRFREPVPGTVEAIPTPEPWDPMTGDYE